MMYLLHLRNDGTALGVFTEEYHYYLPNENRFEKWAVDVAVNSKGTDVLWEDWIDALADKVPGPNGRWETVSYPERDLHEILLEVRRDASY